MFLSKISDFAKDTSFDPRKVVTAMNVKLRVTICLFLSQQGNRATVY